MLVAKQETTRTGYDITWRSLHQPVAGGRATSETPVKGRPARGPSAPDRRRRHIPRPRLGPLMRTSLATICVVGLALGYLAQQAMYTELVYERQMLHKQVDTLQDRAERLALRSERLSSLDRVEALAKARLGMQEPERIARIPLARLDGEGGDAIRMALGVTPLGPNGREGTGAPTPAGRQGLTRVAWDRVSNWFSEWAGIPRAEARAADE